MNILNEWFTREEFECPCCSQDTVDVQLLSVLTMIRKRYKKPVMITSGYRCKEYNDSLPNAATNSQHLYGRAADIWLDHDLVEVADWLDATYKNRISTGVYPSWLHIDTRTNGGKRW